MLIHDRIKQEVNSWSALGVPALMQQFVLRNGTAYQPTSRLGSKLPSKACFENAAKLALDGVGTYVEGYAFGPRLPLVIHHAWVEIDDRAMDPTWEDPMSCQYFGVAFNTEFLREELLRNRVYGLLDIGGGINLDLFLKIDPDFKEFVSERFSK